MRVVYPVIISKGDLGLLVHIPAFDCDTQGKDFPEALNMARDAVSLVAITYEDMGKKLPEADFDIKANEGEMVALIDADLTAYRKKYDNKSVRKNCTIPNWLNIEAERQGINFSAVLQEALQKKLAIG
ncbi:MAG: type II toxin-antitoxin system HicB family antitoxin [Clostridiales bacterium]|nr:type II toxin-antitoxin system HicB family antitoxin [Clostridiales bacterium]